MTTKKIQVIQEENNLVPHEILAESILEISAGVKRLQDGPLNDKALHLLIQHATPTRVPISTVREVLEGLSSLERTYLKKDHKLKRKTS